MDENKKIVKNTLVLYIRMLLILITNMLIVRIVLATLGVDDYGIYNVVGGIVLLFSFMNSTMASASQRFFAYEIGLNNFEKLSRLFSASIGIYVIISVIVLLLSETLGLWFLNNHLVIPIDRLHSANIVFQFSIFTFITIIILVPFNALIIAREKMNVYAYISIIEVLLRLLLAALLCICPYDKLILYSALIFGVNFIILIIYAVYCRFHFEECRFRFHIDWAVGCELLKYSGWNLFGATAGVLQNQGVNIVLNIFAGPTLNAARSIASQINGAISQFVTNFAIAVNPRIVKLYASGNIQDMKKLTLHSSKLSFFLLFLLSMPILLETNYVLSLWLGTFPPYTILFVRLIIINALIDSLSISLTTAVQATGKVKVFNVLVGGVLLFNIPISYLFLSLNYPIEIIFYISIFISFLCLFLRLLVLKYLLLFLISYYIRKVLALVLIISFVSYSFSFMILNFFSFGLLRFFIAISLSLFVTTPIIYIYGLSIGEKKIISAGTKTLLTKLFKR